MNIEFLDEAGMGLSPRVSRESHWQELGGHSDLAELHCSRLSSGFPAVTADRGLRATPAFKSCLSSPNALTPNFPAVVHWTLRVLGVDGPMDVPMWLSVCLSWSLGLD